jgi:hypothetical protein
MRLIWKLVLAACVLFLLAQLVRPVIPTKSATAEVQASAANIPMATPLRSLYFTGVTPLYVLKIMSYALDVEDKHRLLIAKKDITHIRTIYCKDGRGEHFTVTEWAMIHPNISVYPCIGRKNVQVANKGKASFGIVFGDGRGAAGKCVPLWPKSEITTRKTFLPGATVNNDGPCGPSRGGSDQDCSTRRTSSLGSVSGFVQSARLGCVATTCPSE